MSAATQARAGSVTCGVVGVGMIGREHARVLASLQEFDLVACCDIDENVRADVPAGVAFHTDLEALLETANLEAVFVCVPQNLHRAIAEQALCRGLAVFCEKPIAHSLEDADAMIRCAAAQGALLAIGHMLRFDPGYIALHTAATSDEIGTIVQMAARSIAPQFEGRIISGRTTVAQEMMIHHIDIMRWLGGAISRVYAECSPLAVVGPGPDAAVATLAFESGAVGVLDHGWIGADETGLGSDHQFSVFGSHGSLFVDARRSPVSIYGRRGVQLPNLTSYSHPAGVPYGALPTEDRCFARCVRSGEAWPVPLSDARAALECAVAIERSITTTLPVTITARSGNGTAEQTD